VNNTAWSLSSDMHAFTCSQSTAPPASEPPRPPACTLAAAPDPTPPAQHGGGGGGAHGGSKCNDACAPPDGEALHHVMNNRHKIDECNQKYPDAGRRRFLSVAAHELLTQTSSRRRLTGSCPDSLNKALECTWDHCKDGKDASDRMSCMADALNCDDPSSHTVRNVLLVFFVLVLLAGGVGALYVKKLGPFAPKTGSDSIYVATEASTEA
jgi:hypothetical protein